MTREEQIKQYLEERNIPITSLEANSIIEGAEWADRTLIEKACEWLKFTLEGDFGYYGAVDFTNNFRKAMEE